MLRPLRTIVGLEEIPAEYCNNPNESANAQIKANVDYKKSKLCMFYQEIKELVDIVRHSTLKMHLPWVSVLSCM